MQSAIHYANSAIDSIKTKGTENTSLQKSLFTLWMKLENSMEAVTEETLVSPENISNLERNLDEITDAQNSVAKASCQSRATSFEDLLYKLAIWRGDTPDFETMPLYSDRKDQLVYSVFRDLIKITGLDHVKTDADVKTNFFGLGHF